MAFVESIMSKLRLRAGKPKQAKARGPKPSAARPRQTSLPKQERADRPNRAEPRGAGTLPAVPARDIETFGNGVGRSADPERFIEPGRKVTIPAATAADQRVVTQILSYVGDVLTAPGGAITTTEEQRQHCVVLENGYLLVPRTDPINQHVMAVRALIARLGVRIEHQWLVDLDVIRKVYDAHTRRSRDQIVGGADQMKMQRAFVDLVRKAAELKASDVDMIIGRDSATVRLRVQGVITEIAQLTPNYAHQMASAAFAMAGVSDVNYRLTDFQGAQVSDPKHGISLPPDIQSLRLQFNPIPGLGRHMVTRLLYAEREGSDRDVDELGYEDFQIRDIRLLRQLSTGIVVISGPTGSGKSTTLQRALRTLYREKKGEIKIITIEDPPEYVIEGAIQLAVMNADTDEERTEAFRKAIAAALRSDPDVIMIGEVRDAASAKLACEASMTGHQVWCSLHTNDAASILDRLRDKGLEDYRVADPSLFTGLIAQRLVRELCPSCKTPLSRSWDVIHPDIRDNLKIICEAADGLQDVHVANPAGCEHCRKKSPGYRGRTVVAETLRPDEQFMLHIRAQQKLEAIRYWKQDLKGVGMLEHAIIKMLRGQVDPREISRVGPLFHFDSKRIETLAPHIAIRSKP
ncbi:hypothetical protein BHAOGJBA_2953 [Methylobacterium hispanicum]|uniref:Bacterial type II secretion system protein E domain-containing protein n=2 Tax=Methylobacterium hispanicum TaxID=270350 RepID=A0AAV4ZNJ8_9HYPH|nr:hypothetical protein BHAOGJBA_2953 [Methylobacterium hispanicum]